MKSLLLCALLLGACAPTVEQVRAPDGTTNTLVRCDEMPKCILTAQKVCKKKYEVIDQSSYSNETLAGGVKLLVKCDADKTPPAKPPAPTSIPNPSPTLPLPYEDSK